MYLGRCVFAKFDSNIRERVYVHDTLVKVLRSANKPMHAKELLDEASKYVSVRSINAGIISKPPLVNLGQNTFALDYWDDEILGSFASKEYSSLTTNQKKILTLLQEAGSFDGAISYDQAMKLAADYYQNNKNIYLRREQAKTVLDILVESGFLRLEENIYKF